MKKYNQRITDGVIGDCFRACMATILQLPPEVLPNDHSWTFDRTWVVFLAQFGLDLAHSNEKGPIWLEGYWIASVKSLNYKNVSHAIVMHETNKVFHDPSTKKRYKTSRTLGTDRVTGGWRLVVTNATKLHFLEQYRERITSV